MSRNLLVVLLGVIVTLSFSMIGLAQEYWRWNNFTAQEERFKYEIISYSFEWDWQTGEEVRVETRQFQTMDLRKIDDEVTEVTMGYTYNVPSNQLGEQLSFMGGMFSMPFLMGGGDWFGEFIMLGLFASDLELEVGNSMQTFDGSRIRVVEKQTVAGIEGYFWTKHRRDTDDGGNRIDILTSEWVVAPDVGWPLLVRVFQDDQVVYSMELVEYYRN